MATQTKDFMTVQTYGNREDVIALSQRIRVMVPGGSKLSNDEVQALAQVSIVTKCNPFIGEIWYIPGRGPMIGIKGARRHGNETVKRAGGDSAYFTANMTPCSADVVGYKGDIKDLAAAYECTVEDSVSTRLYQSMFLETVNTLRAAGSPDPVGEAREICGKRPQWKGYGYSTVSENSKMNKQALAMKRAEADGLKRRFDIPFGAEVAEGDTAAETGAWVEVTPSTISQPVDVEFPKDENVSQDTGEVVSAVEMIDPMGEWAIAHAMQAWNLDKKATCAAVASKKLGKLIDKNDFIQIVNG